MKTLDKPGVGARRAAIFALALWREAGTFPEQSLQAAPDHAFALELVGAALRHKASLEWMLKRCVAKLPGGELWAALLVGAAQLICLPGVAPYAAVGETVEAAKPLGRRAAAFVNAALRRLQREQSALCAALAQAPAPLQHNVPPRLWNRWLQHFGQARTEAIARAMAQPPRVALRPLPPWSAPEACSPHPDDPAGTFLVPRGCRVETLAGFAEGRFVVQDAATRHAIELLDLRPGLRVLDACAAPGGKTVQIAARLFAGEGAEASSLLANEVSAVRLERLRETLARCGFAERVALRSLDATAPEAFGSARFERILLDVPCSNTGVMGRRADARWTWTPQKLRELCATQARLLDACAPLLLPGGRLVYSTCSIEPEEDAAQVEAFLAKHPGFRLLESRLILPDETHDGAYAAALLA